MGTMDPATSAPGPGVGVATVGDLDRNARAHAAAAEPDASAERALSKGTPSAGCRSLHPTSRFISGASWPSPCEPPQNCSQRIGWPSTSSSRISSSVSSSPGFSLCTGSTSKAASDAVKRFLSTDLHACPIPLM